MFCNYICSSVRFVALTLPTACNLFVTSPHTRHFDKKLMPAMRKIELLEHQSCQQCSGVEF